MSAAVLTPSTGSITKLCQALSQDQVVGVPTETVYGLAGNAFSPAAVARIFETKGRPTFDPLIVHVSPEVDSLSKLETAGIISRMGISETAAEKIELLMAAFWPGPLTLILPKGSRIADLVTSGLNTVGVRMPAHPDFQNLLRALPFPLAAPSANRFGRISPTTADHVRVDLGERIAWILDGGPSAIGVESTVLDCSADLPFSILRPGGLGHEAITAVLDSIGFSMGLSASAQKKSPGHLESHYAPRKPLILLPSRVIELNDSQKSTLHSFVASLKNQGEIPGFLSFFSDIDLDLIQDSPALFMLKDKTPARKVLNSEELQLAAQHLFAKMRELDDTRATVLIAEGLTQQDGLAPAIQDRLYRASSQRLLPSAGGEKVPT